jgi:hypothetical protein
VAEYGRGERECPALGPPNVLSRERGVSACGTPEHGQNQVRVAPAKSARD